MLKSYLFIALRSFRKDRTNALISLSGLIVGLTCVMLIVGYIRYELSFDKSYSNAGRIYQVVNNLEEETGSYTSANVPSPLAPTLKREIPEIEAQSSLDYGSLSVFNANKDIQLVDQMSVDDDFFSMFNLKFKYGNSNLSFKKEHSLVLTERGAKMLYGVNPAIGTIIYGTDSIAYTITGILEDIPNNTFFKADAFVNHPTSDKLLDYISYTGTSAVIMIGKNNSIQQVKNRMNALYKKYNFQHTTLSFIPVGNLHLYGGTGTKDFPENYNIENIKYVYIYGCIALLILLIGCFNFINLTIARSLERKKEIGVRKLFGAKRGQLIFQFIGESLMFFAIAMPISIILAVSCWKPFSLLLNIHAGFSFLLNIQTLLIFTAISIVAGFLCSLYPAFMLSKLNPVSTLKGGYYKGLRLNLGLRRILIVLQFSISIILIIITMIVHSQLRFLNNQNLGFNKSNLIVLNWQDYGQKENSLKNELLRNPNILSASVSRMNIGKFYGSTFTGRNPNDSTQGLSLARITADRDFIKTLEVPLLDKHDFGDQFLKIGSAVVTDSLKKNDLSPCYVSKGILKTYNIKGDPIGRSINTIGAYIIGVIGDFKAISLKEENPMILMEISNSPIRYGYLYVKVSGENTQPTIGYIQKSWKRFFPQNAFAYSFVDDRIAHLYDSEIRLTKLFNIFALLAIVISCTGLFSLISLMVRKRTKEIGIRKVMGASVTEITIMISKDFLWLIAISFVVAMPFAYISMHRWLQSYANKTKIYWWLFAIAGVSAFIIAFLSISFKALAAAKANPVESLKEE